MKIVDFFCGCGGFSGGFHEAGFEIVQAFDVDKYAVKSYNANFFPTKAEIRDIREITADELKPADGWLFGFPCQDLSIAGKRKGLFEGERSNLFFEVMRLLEEVAEKPKFILAENVKGVKKYLFVIEKEYQKRGYRMTYILYNSKYWGVPQNRERYFILGIRNDLNVSFRFPEQQTEFVPALWTILEPEVDEKYYIDDEKAQKIIKEGFKKINSVGRVHACITPGRIKKRQNEQRMKEENEAMFTLITQDIHGVMLTKDGCSYAIDANYHKGISPKYVGTGRRTHIIEKCKVRKLTPRECFRLQGFPDSYQLVCSDTQLYKQAGNAVTWTVAKAIAEKIKEVI